MKPFKSHSGIVVPLDIANIDMDQIISKQYLKRIEKTGYASGLFYNWRYTYDNKPREDFILNDSKYERASILLVRENFGCGSSWEHAVWALLDYGVKAVIAPSFADLFYINSLNMGLLSLCLKEADINQLFTWAQYTELKLDVNLDKQIVRNDNEDWVRSFEIDNFNKEALLKGFKEEDQISITLNNSLAEINAYEETRSRYTL